VQALAPATAADRADRGAAGARQRGGSEHLVEHGVDLGPQLLRVGCDAGLGQPPFDVGRAEELLHVGPHNVQGGLHPPVRLRGAVAETHRPTGCVVAVVGHLLDTLARHRRDHGVARAEQALQQREPPGGEQQQPRDRPGEVQLVAQLGQRDVAELRLRALVGEGVLVAPAAFDVPGPGEQDAGLAEQIERDVGERHLLLQLRCVADPLGDAVAADQGVITEHEAVLGEVTGVDAVGHGRVDLALHVLDARPERPARVVVAHGLGERLVGVGRVLFLGVRVRSHRCGTSSGIA
jgi:hypothetical protein